MNTAKCGDDRHYVKLDHMIQSVLHEDPLDNGFILRGNDEILDFIMENPDLSVTSAQIVFILRHAAPAVSPMRKDYFDVLARLVSEAKAHGDSQLVKSIYLLIPFYPSDQKNQQKWEFYQGGILYFLSLGLYQIVGELYAKLAGEVHGSTKERILLCERALEFLDQTSKEYACVLALREMLCHMEHQENEEYYHYCAFGETISQKGKSIFLSPTFPCLAFRKKAEALCFDVVILKGNEESYETMTSLAPSGFDKEVVDETMSADTAKPLIAEKELLRHPDEKVICQADGKEYVCHVFSIRRVESSGEKIVGDIKETNYYVSGIGPIRTVIFVDGKKYIYDLCEYSIKGGNGMIPCCVGNTWHYKQEGCPDFIDQVIKREIIAQNGEEYLISGWNYAGTTLFSSCDA